MSLKENWIVKSQQSSPKKKVIHLKLLKFKKPPAANDPKETKKTKHFCLLDKTKIELFGHNNEQ